MDQIDSGNSSEIDLESGGTTDEDVGDDSLDWSGVNSKKQMQRSWSKDLGQELLDASDGMQSSHSQSRKSTSDEIFIENEDNWSYMVREEKVNAPERKMTYEKPKKPDSTRHPKPPRPPKGGLSLDAADMRLAKEVSELALIKRKRAERMKASRKMRKEKASSTSITSVIATIITVLFILVIISQGILGARSS